MTGLLVLSAFVQVALHHHADDAAFAAGDLRAEVDGVVQDRPMTAGTSYARPAGVEHDIQNGSDHPIAFVEIEVKRPDLLVMDKA